MEDKLLMCRPWDDDAHSERIGAYQVIVSDVVFGNDSHSMFQFHIAVLWGDCLAQFSDLFPNLPNDEVEVKLEEWETAIRSIILENVSWESHVPDGGVVKIWYYGPHEDFTVKSSLFLRCAITAVNVNAPDDEILWLIRQRMLAYVVSFVKSGRKKMH